MAKLTAPITTTKVANTLSTSSHNVGTLCTNSNINKWSKWKPVSYNTKTGITESQLKSIYYGLNIPTYPQQITASTVTYNKPTGGETSPYRLGDFRNYNHDAKFALNYVASKTYQNYFNDKSSITVKINDDPDSITYYDVSDHPAFSGIENSTNRWYISNNQTYLTKDETITGGVRQVEITNSDMQKLGNGIVTVKMTDFSGFPGVKIELDGNPGVRLFAGADENDGTNNDVGVATDTSLASAQDWTYYQTGAQGHVIDLDTAKPLIFGNYTPDSATPEQLSPLRLYTQHQLTEGNTRVTFRYTLNGNEVIHHANMYSLKRLDNDWVISQWTQEPNWDSPSGGNSLRPSVVETDIPTTNGQTVSVEISFEYALYNGAGYDYYQFFPSMRVNMKRTAGVQPSLVNPNN